MRNSVVISHLKIELMFYYISTKGCIVLRIKCTEDMTFRAYKVAANNTHTS